ncbi:glycosyltransferase [Paenibacillus sp. EPM92]|uniref:glycosyltransferase n=1 Tax=Paenibacillus sp. EPM92 TaxID=1561195 RepID=UPI0019169B51
MKISVALCTFNGEKYIKDQLQSILNQTYKVDEIVITDDGSTDNTIRVIKNFFWIIILILK